MWCQFVVLIGKLRKLLESYVSKPTALGDVAINHHSTMYHD